MATRFNSRSLTRFNVPGLASGYDDNVSNVALEIPAAGVEDVDAALFKLFDDQIRIVTSSNEMGNVANRRVPVIFAASEKWALAKKNKPLRDKNGTLILPLIMVVRTAVKQDVEDITGRGINQQTGEIVIRRRLDVTDRGYQNLINRQMVKHQQNVAVTPEVGDEGQLTTLRSIGDLEQDDIVRQGGLLAPNRRNNVYETIVIPSPQFFTATYEVTFWAQYTIQMVQMIEHLIASFLPQGQSWKLETEKGYWYVASVDGNVYTSETNVDDMSAEERMIKYKFNINVPGYIVATSTPGTPVPIKRYISQPSVSFDVGADICEAKDNIIEDPFLGADDPTLPLSNGQTQRRDQRDPGNTRLYTTGDVISPHDAGRKAVRRGQPLTRYAKITTTNWAGKLVVKYVRVKSSNPHTGETSFFGVDLSGVEQITFVDLPSTASELQEFTDEFTDEFL